MEENREEEVEEKSCKNAPEDAHVVQLATLVLPPSAIESGLEAGEGNQVVLEASNETVEALLDSTSISTPAAGWRTPQEQQQHSHISAVVDLEKLSELVGDPQEDFLTGLHEDIQEQAAEEEQEKASVVDSEIAAAGETQPLVPIEEGAAVTDRISLPADPFIETLADALPSPDADEDDTFTEAAVTKTTEQHDEQQHYLAHDAFLLDVPISTNDGEVEHRYVLALPEIQVGEHSVASTLSGGSQILFLKRAQSILPTHLPTDIQELHLEAVEHVPTEAEPAKVHLDIVVERKVPVIGYVILLSGLVALASVGAALDLQEGGVTATMKTLWRQCATCVALAPFVAQSYRQRQHEHGGWSLSMSQLALLPVCAASYAYMTLAFVWALEMTTMADAFVLSNMTSLVIIAGRAVLGLPVLFLEGLGAVTGFIGAAICANDASRTTSGLSGVIDDGNPTSNAMLGNAVALSASFGTAVYLIIAKDLRSSMDLFVFMFTIMGLGSVFLLLFMLLNGETLAFDMHPIHGVFGWLNLAPDRLPLEMYMAVVCNCLGTTGYIAVMKYFQPIVPATVMLLEPVIGALLGTAAGTAPLPGLQTWLGDVVVATGTFLVIRSGSSKTEKIDATEALRPCDGTIDDSKVISMSTPTRNSKADAAKVIWDPEHKPREQ